MVLFYSFVLRLVMKKAVLSSAFYKHNAKLSTFTQGYPQILTCFPQGYPQIWPIRLEISETAWLFYRKKASVRYIG